MKRFHGVFFWFAVLLTPVLLYTAMPNLTVKLLNRAVARVLLASTEVGEVFGALDSLRSNKIDSQAIAEGE